mmetsp:Transcript_26016/g.54293  ORF Transcript_26016/g.54293 Transcript_26016/m.54293 type:complete len:213 (-) Transcript_26016:433-1071(-)
MDNGVDVLNEPGQKLGRRTNGSSFQLKITSLIVPRSNVHTNDKFAGKMLAHKIIHLIFPAKAFPKLGIQLVVRRNFTWSSWTINRILVVFESSKEGGEEFVFELVVLWIMSRARKGSIQVKGVRTKQVSKDWFTTTTSPPRIKWHAQGGTQMSYIGETGQAMSQSTTGDKFHGRCGRVGIALRHHLVSTSFVHQRNGTKSIQGFPQLGNQPV